MYRRYSKGEITLWCDGRCDGKSENGKGKRKREVSSNYEEREDEVTDIYKELVAKHSEDYKIPKLCLWARMISSNLHGSMENPPKIPVFGGCPQKRQKNDLSTALSGAAIML